jgi:hypothetical protein
VLGNGWGGAPGFIGSTEFRERSAAAEAVRWIQIGARFEKSLDGSGRGTGDVTSGKTPSSFYSSRPCSSRCPLCVLTESQR